MLTPLKQRYWAILESADRVRQAAAMRTFARAQTARAETETVGTPAEHARAAAEWIVRAQDATGCGGIAKCYRPIPGRWENPYPETSGYIIESLLEYGRATGDGEYDARARRVADWLLAIQLPCGGIQAGTFGPGGAASPTIFNTGQVVHGWIDSWNAWHDATYADAAVRACRWLVEQQDDDGCWRRAGSPSVIRQSENVYNVRVAWAMIRAGQMLDEASFVRAGHRNLDWAATREARPGWMDDNDFSDCARPIMHTIAYAAEGFFEAGLLLGEARFVDLALRTCRGVAGTQRADGHLPGRLDSRFQPAASWSCLTGDAQMLLLWRRVAEQAHNDEFSETAARLSLALRSKQALRHQNPGVRGGLPGSHPLGGAYMKHTYPNWAAKFFLDAMLTEMTTRPDARPTELLDAAITPT